MMADPAAIYLGRFFFGFALSRAITLSAPETVNVQVRAFAGAAAAPTAEAVGGVLPCAVAHEHERRGRRQYCEPARDCPIPQRERPCFQGLSE